MVFLACAGESAGLWDAGVGGNELLVQQDQIFARTNFNQLCILIESGFEMH